MIYRNRLIERGVQTWNWFFGETLEATYQEDVKEYTLRIPYLSLGGLRSIVDFRAETAAEAKKLALEKMATTLYCRRSKKKPRNRDRS